MNSILETIKRRWYFSVPLILVVLFLVLRTVGKKPPALTFVAPATEDIEEVVEVSGNVTAAKIARLKFLGGGKLTYLGVSEGDEVKKYQRIASIDTRDLQKSLKESLNSSAIGRNNLVEGQSDAGDQSYSAAAMRSLSNLQYTLNNNVLDVEIKNLAIENSSIYAPFAGIVTSLPTNTAGMQVVATDAFEVVDPSTLEFSGEVDEADIAKVQSGLPVHLILDAYPNDTTDTTVKSIAMKATPSTKASGGTVFLVKAQMPEDLFHFRMGMNGTMKIVTRSAKQALTIPLSDVTERDNKNYVQVRTGENTAVEREVTVGIESDTRVQIVSGLNPTDQIVDVK